MTDLDPSPLVTALAQHTDHWLSGDYTIDINLYTDATFYVELFHTPHVPHADDDHPDTIHREHLTYSPEADTAYYYETHRHDGDPDDGFGPNGGWAFENVTPLDADVPTTPEHTRTPRHFLDQLDHTEATGDD